VAENAKKVSTIPHLPLPSPRRTHPAWVAVVALVVTGLVGISRIP